MQFARIPISPRNCFSCNVLLMAVLFAGNLCAAEPAPTTPTAPGGAAETPWLGYRGANGTGVFRDNNPPSAFDEKSGKNILWKAPMPNWGHSQPVEMAGRVFVISEGGWPESQDLPLLQCLDAQTGKELWRKDLNHLPATALGAQEQQEALKAWHDVLADFRTDYTFFNEFIYAADEAGKEAAKAKFKALGRDFAGWSGGGYGQLRKLKSKCDEAKAKLAAKAGLTLETWQHGCGMGQSCFGQTFPTPVTDGANLFVVTAFGGFFCFDKDGATVWTKYYPGAPGEYCRNGRSPLIYRGLPVIVASPRQHVGAERHVASLVCENAIKTTLMVAKIVF